MKVNFLDLKSQYLSIKPEIDQAIASVFEKAAFAGGPVVEEFAQNFAKKHQSKYCVAVNNGTSALHIMLMALEIGSGDEIIVPANTFFATAEAVSLTGATPVFVDCDQQYYNLDPERIESAITDKTKAILVVHLYGQPAQMDRIKHIAAKHNILLLEDCAQAHLAAYKNTCVGNFGLAGSFSFYPGKNLGAYGEAGAVVTNDENLYQKMQALKDHGSSKKYFHHLIGHNYRMSGIQGAILNVKLDYIDDWTNRRIKNARLYAEYLTDLPMVGLPGVLPEVKHAYHLYVIRVADRDGLQKYLGENGVFTGIHYPIPCHLQEAYHNLGYSEGSFPVSEKISREILSLPMSEQLTEVEIEYVASCIKKYFQD